MPAKTSSVLVIIGCALAPAACAVQGGTTSTLKLAVDGPGRIASRDGSLDCGAPTGTCETSTFVGWTGDMSSNSFQLCAVPAAANTVFDSWTFVVAADCPGCGADDPEMGAIETHGNEADVRVDVNPGYDVDATATATFVATGAPTTGTTGTAMTCW